MLAASRLDTRSILASARPRRVVYKQQVSADAVQQSCLHVRSAAYQRPSALRFLRPLPAAPTGKLLKNLMKAMAQDAAPTPP